MNQFLAFSRFFASFPLRWRLALVSFGLLALLLVALGIIVSTTEEQALLTNQANVISNEGRIAQMQLQVTKIELTEQQIRTFPDMSKTLSSDLVDTLHTLLGQNVGVSLLSFSGNVLASDASESSNSSLSRGAVVTLAQADVQSRLTGRFAQPYFLASDNLGQRELIVVLPIAAWDKSVQLSKSDPSREDMSGYRKALLQLSVSTVLIDQAVASTRLTLVLTIVIALSLAAALTLPLIRLALRPLVEMQQVSSRIAAGALNLRLAEPSTRDEIGGVARAFNRMVAQLETAFARQKRFVADVSHELRTPLTGLSGSLEMLLLGADNGDEETARRLVSGMYAEVERMQRLVADLLVLARLDEGKLRLHVEAVQVLTLLEDVYEQVQGLVQGQTLRYQVLSEPLSLWGDADQLRRVLLNLMENAFKFTAPGGTVELVASREGNAWIILQVRDSGIGISPEDLPHVFERFYRADPSRSRQSARAGGSGLGLSLVQELVEAHRGTIAIDSIPGQGTTVTLRLPAACGPQTGLDNG